jgi:hypothetical protein
MSDGSWIGVDLDGVLAEWHVHVEQSSKIGSDNVMQIGPPIPMMVERVKGWLVEGKRVRILTARVAACGAESSAAVDDLHFAANQRGMIQAWCLEHLGQILPVTATKDWQMIEFYDDRCVQMITNTGESLQGVYEATLHKLRREIEELRQDLQSQEDQHITQRAAFTQRIASLNQLLQGAQTEN